MQTKVILEGITRNYIKNNPLNWNISKDWNYTYL